MSNPASVRPAMRTSLRNPTSGIQPRLRSPAAEALKVAFRKPKDSFGIGRVSAVCCPDTAAGNRSKRRQASRGLLDMADQSKTDTQHAAPVGEERPVPSQAEGDRETVEQDLAEKDQTKSAAPGQE